MANAQNNCMKEFEVNEETTADDVEMYMFQFECLCKGNALDINNDTHALEMGGLFLGVCGKACLNVLLPQVENFNALKLLKIKEIDGLLMNSFVVQNVRYHIVRMYDRKWVTGERFGDYIAALKQLGKAARESTDEAIIKKLLLCESTPVKMRKEILKTETTLIKLIQWQKNREVEEATLEKFEPKSSISRVESRPRAGSFSDIQRPKTTNPCKFCGFEWDTNHREKCPAKSANCRICKQTGHYGRCCPSKLTAQPRRSHSSSQQDRPPSGYKGRGYKVHAIGMDNESEAYGYEYATAAATLKEMNTKKLLPVYSVSTIQTTDSPYKTIEINGVKFPILFDTGSQLNILWLPTFKLLRITCPLEPTGVWLKPFLAKQAVKPLGQFRAKTKFMNVELELTFVVVDSEEKVDDLLSWDAIKAFNLDLNQVFTQKSINKVGITLKGAFNFDQVAFNEHIHQKYAKLFEPRIGFRSNIKIAIDLDPAIHPIRVPKQQGPVCMEKATIEKLRLWLADGAISLVPPGTRLTWLSALNPVEKKPGVIKDRELTAKEIRLTVNYKNTLNKCFVSSDYNFNTNTLTTAADLKRDLAGARIFSTADITDFFSSIPITQESKILTAFTSPIGICQFECMPQGLTIASQACQEANVHDFGDILNLKNAVDDFLISGKPSEEHIGKPTEFESCCNNHNNMLTTFLDRCVEKDVTLNSKSQFGVKKATFFGYEFSEEGIKPAVDKMRAFKESTAPKNCSEVHSFLGKATHFVTVFALW